MFIMIIIFCMLAPAGTAGIPLHAFIASCFVRCSQVVASCKRCEQIQFTHSTLRHSVLNHSLFSSQRVRCGFPTFCAAAFAKLTDDLPPSGAHNPEIDSSPPRSRRRLNRKRQFFRQLSSRHHHKTHTSIMREIVHLQAGQCGNQIGSKVSKRVRMRVCVCVR